MWRPVSFLRWAAWISCMAAAPALAWGASLVPPGSSTFRVVPEQPTTRDAISIRNDFTGCSIHGPIHAQGLRIDLGARVIDYLIPYGNDAADCGPEDYLENVSADTAVGYLPAGSYTVRFFSCTILYEPETVCEDENVGMQLQFVVTESDLPRAMTVPASSAGTRAALLALLVLAAAWRLRRR